MLRRCVIITCVLVLGPGASNAEQPSSPGVAYVDGLPCNSLCLSYLAWSRRLSVSVDASSRPEVHPQVPLVQPETSTRNDRSRPRASLAKAKRTPATQLPQAKVAGVQPAGKATVPQTRVVKSAARPPNDESLPRGDGSQPAGDVTAAVAPAATPPVPESKDMPLADLPPTGSAAAASDKPVAGIAVPHPDAKSIREQVTAATAVASQITVAAAIPIAEQKPELGSSSSPRDTAMPADTRQIAKSLVALVMVGPDIKSVSDLSDKTIALDDPQSAAGREVRAAIVAAGATGIQLTDGPTKAIDRLIAGSVPAAVLALVSAEAAEDFPVIAGFKVLQVPLSPSAAKAGTTQTP